MQNAWRFVEDEVLRDRLKEAKGIGTPATRAEIIGGLKRQDFLVAQGKNIVPTDIGLKLFGVLKEADPALGRSGRDGAARMPSRRCRCRQAGDGGRNRCRVRRRAAHYRKLKDGSPTGGAPLLARISAARPTIVHQRPP